MISFTFAQCRRANLLVCHIWVSPHFLFYGCFSALCLHVSHVGPGLYCIVLFSQRRCLRVVCIHNVQGAPSPLVCRLCVCGGGETASVLGGPESARSARVVCFHSTAAQRRPRCSACPERSALARDTSSTSRPTGTFRPRMKRTGTRSCGGGLSQSSDAVQS